MSFSTAILSTVLVWPGQLSDSGAEVTRETLAARRLLLQASELATKELKSKHYWARRSLWRIAREQARAGDFSGAWKSTRTRGSQSDPDAGLAELAAELAAAGRRDESLAVLAELQFPTVDREAREQERVRSRWIEYLTAKGELKKAEAEVDLLQSQRFRVASTCLLATAYAETDQTPVAAEHFERAVSEALTITGSHRVSTLLQISESQLSAGVLRGAARTKDLLRSIAVQSDSRQKSRALAGAASIAAKLGNKAEARRLYEKAITAVDELDERAELLALCGIATVQARSGCIDDARNTVEQITSSAHVVQDSSLYLGSRAAAATAAVSRAQLKAGDVDGAVRTATSIVRWTQHRDDALHAAIEYLLDVRDFENAVATAAQCDNDSRKAAAFLKVAITYAETGDSAAASNVASQIELTGNSKFTRGQWFDYRRPKTWGACYDIGDAMTGVSSAMASKRSTEVATLAIVLAGVLPIPPSDYGEMLERVRDSHVITAMARASAARGELSNVLDWALHVHGTAETKVDVLVGVASGILDRQTAL